MASGSLTAQPLGQQGDFNWIFLVDLIVCGILAVFFLFYFNRLFATVLSYAIRAYTWHKFRAYIDITSLQFSLLGGRLFFKSIKYHGHNQTVLVHDGNITWRYWLRQVQEAQAFQRTDNAQSRAESPLESSEESDDKSRPRNRSVGKEEAGNVSRPQNLPCRILVKVSGVEAFLYNQTPVYDNILANLAKGAKVDVADAGATPLPTSRDAEFSTRHSDLGDEVEPRKTRSSVSESFLAHTVSSSAEENSLPAFLRLFPIQIDCKKAAAAVGNEHTPSIVTAKLENASGRIDADNAASLDLYKLLFSFDFNNVAVSLKPNNDFTAFQLQTAAGAEDLEHRKKDKSRFRLPNPHLLRRLRKLLAPLHALFTLNRRSDRSVRTASLLSNDETVEQESPQLPGQSHWQGLARYLDDSGHNEHREWDNVEYARFSQLVDCEKVHMLFYWDVPGKAVRHQGQRPMTPVCELNGAIPPEYGLSLSVDGGVINYGPWADRQRIVLQNVFFPASFHDAQPTNVLADGETRLATVFKLHLCLDKDVVLRIPTREPSKDWQWQGRTATLPKSGQNDAGIRKRKAKQPKKQPKGKKHQQPVTGGADVRPFGWIDLKVLADSTVNYTMDMYARKDGYHNKLDLDVKGTEITSSVNHALLWRAGNLALEADLSNPLQWNTLRKWHFNIICHGLDLFILRDHMFLITDLVTDWSTGPPPDFYTFVPFQYVLDLNFDDFKLFLNSNDANIVNDPSDIEDNNYLILQGQTLNAELGIPIDQYRPTQNGITFDVVAHNMSLDMSNPPRNTLHSLLRKKRVATLKKLTLSGSHTYFVEQAPGLTDILQMDICGTDLELKAFGFLVRHFINVKENYFGEFLHFKTLEEYQDLGGDAANAEADLLGRHTFRPANDLDVILCIVTEHPIIMLPANLYSAESYVKAELPTASVDLRVTNYYLDLSTDISPIAISWFGPSENGRFESTTPGILIDRTNVSGHRLFGLPPTEPAYVSNWDIGLGDVSGDCSFELIQQLVRAGRALAFSLDDHENALPLAQTAPIPEATFVRVNTGTVCLWVYDGKAAIRLYCDPVEVHQNDYARRLFSSRLVVNIPNLSLTCADADSTARHRVREAEKPAPCIAFVQTSVELTVVTRKAHFQAEYETQQKHIRQQDARSGRAHFLLDDIIEQESELDNDMTNDPPSMSLPSLSLPIGKAMRKPRSVKDQWSRESSSEHPNPTQNDSHRGRKSVVNEEAARHAGSGHAGTIPDFNQSSTLLNLWSPFAVPDAHFSQLHIDLEKVPRFTAAVADADALSETESSNPQDINLNQNDNVDHSTVMVRFEPGIRIYVEPRINEDVFSILSTLLPKLPVDVIDTFQMDIMEKVSQIQGLKKSRGGIVEFNVVVPTIDARLYNEDSGQRSISSSSQARDQLDLNLSYLNLTIRSRKFPAEQETEKTLLLHLTLESALVKLSNRLSETESMESAIRLGFDDVLVWLVLSKSTSVHVSFKDFLTAVSGQQSTYLASVFARYAALGTSIQNRANQVMDAAKARLRYFTDYLTSNTSVTSDPPYLSRMNYMFRAFPDHFRKQDSWKIIARFRHIFEGLSCERRNDLEMAMVKGCDNPTDTSSILETWAEWCSWDIPNIERTQVFKTLLGDTEPQRSDDRLEPTELTLRGGTVRLAIETGSKSSEISLGSLSIGLSIIPPSQPSGLMLVDENVRTKTVLQAHTAVSVFRLNWDVLEQADQFIDIYFEKVAPALNTLPDAESSSPPRDVDEGPLRQDFHVVLTTDQGSIELDSINLRHVSSTEDLRVSVIGTSRASQSYGQCFSVLLASKHAFTELHGRRNRIWRTDLTGPSVYADYRQKIRGNSALVNVGGSYKQLNITVEQELLGLLEVVDSIFVDEVVYIRRLQKRITEEQRKLPERQQHPEPSRILHFNVAFLAGKFMINLAMLKALKLSISGDTADIRVKPGVGSKMALDVELHLGAMEHALVRTGHGITDQRALLHTPPAVGTLGLQIGDKIDIIFSGIIQEVLLEACAVQSVLTIINQPEVQGVLEAIRDQISDLQHRITEVLAEKNQVPAEATTEETKTLIYDVSVSLGGVKVSANAPAVTAGKTRAELTLGIGNVQTSISNKDLQDSKAIPNIHAQVQDIGATLALIKHGKRSPCGHVSVGLTIDCTLQDHSSGVPTREIKARSDALDVNVFAETGPTIVDIVTHVQRKILDLDLSREVEYLKRLRHSREKRLGAAPPPKLVAQDVDGSTKALHTSSVITNFSLDLRRIRLAWIVTDFPAIHGRSNLHDLDLTFTRISLSIQKQNEARLSIQNMQLQLAPRDLQPFERSENSALLPEVVFTVKYDTNKKGVKIAFQAAGKAIELRLDSGFVFPISLVHKSISLSMDKYRAASANWRSESIANNAKRGSPLGGKRLLSLQADASFGGAIIYVQGEAPPQSHVSLRPPPSDPSNIKMRDRRTKLSDKEDIIATSLRAPGMALKVEYTDDLPDQKEPTLNGEIKIDASTNTVYPELVPIVLQISDNVKDVMRKTEEAQRLQAPARAVQQSAQKSAQRLVEDEPLLNTDPSAIFGKTKLNLGLRICRQEFGLSCQPIARVNAKAHIEDIYITMNTINSSRFGHFYALSTTITKLEASVQHVYSRESTFNFNMESIVMSLMNSKHLSGGASGVSAVLKIAPTKTALNVRQLQDLLLFREIWFPEELRDTDYTGTQAAASQQEEMFVKRYHQASSAAAFPWNATVTIADLIVDLELGQSIGKSTFNIKNMWASSTKSSAGKQDLCLGIDEVSIKSIGRMSGFVDLSEVNVRTSIEWPATDLRKAPLIQAAMGFGKLRAKSAFDYQPFAFADIEAFHFLMYNVREKDDAPDRLVAILDGDKVFVFCTSTSPAQAVGLYQAFDRMIQEKQGAYKQSMRDLENQLQRRSLSQFNQQRASTPAARNEDQDHAKFPITLHTDVVVQLRAISFGAFPGTFFDNQILKLEASEMQARFAVGLVDGRIHSDLGMTLGQLQVALASVKRVSVPKTLGDISIDEVIHNASTAKGGIILRVPRVVASMQTWQSPHDNLIDFIFKSLFEGKVDVGWNYSRISFIRGMWNTHSRSLASRLGKPLPESHVKITAGPRQDDTVPSTSGLSASSTEQEKITAVVNMPQSKFEYRALEPPIVETPQLRDMGEATPPLEWIGLHREKLPNVVHQVLIVTLLEVAKEVEDAYESILGSS
ncbi:hypothetical protein MBLNU459_g5081t1 [Dothideomycetes sp. NU459]